MYIACSNFFLLILGSDDDKSGVYTSKGILGAASHVKLDIDRDR